MNINLDEVTDQDTANRIVARANAGWGKGVDKEGDIVSIFDFEWTLLLK